MRDKRNHKLVKGAKCAADCCSLVRVAVQSHGTRSDCISTSAHFLCRRLSIHLCHRYWVKVSSSPRAFRSWLIIEHSIRVNGGKPRWEDDSLITELSLRWCELSRVDADSELSIDNDEKIDPCVDLWYAAEKPEFPFECGASFHSVEQSEQFWKSFIHLKEESPSGRMIRMIHGSFRTLPLSFSIQSWFSDIFIAFVSATVARLGGKRQLIVKSGRV